MNPDPHLKNKLVVWWTIWGATLFFLAVLYAVLGLGRPMPPPAGKDLLWNLAPVVPLFVSIVIRWLVLPRFSGLDRALPMFIAGIALAEGCGIFALFFSGPYRDALWFLGVLGVAQYVPLFARRLAEPKPQGFVPNN